MLYCRILFVFAVLSPGLGFASDALCRQAHAEVARACNAEDSQALLQTALGAQPLQQGLFDNFFDNVNPCAEAFHECARRCKTDTAPQLSNPTDVFSRFRSDPRFGGLCRQNLIIEVNNFAKICHSRLRRITQKSRRKRLTDASRKTLVALCTPMDEEEIQTADASNGDTICGLSGGANCETSTAPVAQAQDQSSPRDATFIGQQPKPEGGGNPTFPTSSAASSPAPTSTPTATEPEPTAPTPNPHPPLAEDVTASGEAAEEQASEETQDVADNEAGQGEDGENSGKSDEAVSAFAGDGAESPFGAVEVRDVKNLMDLANNLGAAQVPSTQDVDGSLNLPVGDYSVQQTQPTQIQAGQLGAATSARPRLRTPRFQGFTNERKQQLRGSSNPGGGAAGGGIGGGGGGGGGIAGGGGGAGGGARGNGGGGRRGSAYSKYADQLGGNSFYGAGKGGASGGSGTAAKAEKGASVAQQAKIPLNSIKGVPSKAFDPRLGLRMINSQFKKGLKNYMIQVGEVRETPTIFKEINYNYTVDGENRPRRFLNSRGQN